MSATATPATSDRSDFRTVMVGGTEIGLITAAGVVAFLVVSRQVTAVLPQQLLEALIVLATGVAVSFPPGRVTAARPRGGLPGAAALGVWGTGVFMAVVIIAPRPVKGYPWCWGARGGGGTRGDPPGLWVGGLPHCWRGAPRTPVCGWARWSAPASLGRSPCSRWRDWARHRSGSQPSRCGCGSCDACRTSSPITWRRARRRSKPPLPRRTELLVIQLLALAPGALTAQRRGWELHLGRWYNGNRAETYEFRTSAPLGAAFTHGFGVTVLVNDTLGRHRAFYGLGYEIQAWRGRPGLAPYALAGLALGLSTDITNQQLAVQWSIGGGVEWRPLAWLAAGSELRYRLEDRGPRGFWRPGDDARKGVSAAIGISLSSGRASARPGQSGVGAPPDLPPPAPPTTITGNAADVVQTALESLGTPYVWGGTADNGFDCSGLVQYADGPHRVRVPRT